VITGVVPRDFDQDVARRDLARITPLLYDPRQTSEELR
jgi:hypothetical protein